ncbi:MAG: patatin-like phospholipase family protein [Burkholderiaceae bacterium]|nr:patatin-like phospholipase family protein [Burkholderiaceae bacterium]
MIDVTGARARGVSNDAAPEVEPSSDVLLGRLKGLSFAKDGSAQRVAAACRSFTHHFEREAGALAGMIGPAGIADFARNASARFEAIVACAFDELPRSASGAVTEKDFASAMRVANKEAVMALDRLKVDAARANLMAESKGADVRPQIVPKAGKFVVIRPAPQLENLVLRGGGAKGIGYSAALDQLDKAGLLSGVRHIAGSSAGALTAACLAGGMTAAQFEKGPAEILFRQSPLAALGGADLLARAYPDMKMERGLAPAVTSLRVIDESLSKSVQNYLKANWQSPEFEARLNAIRPPLTSTQLGRLIELQKLPDFDVPHKKSMITFADLKMLNELAPGTFKQLTLTGWNVTDQREDYFSADTTPDMPVAYAARISMAFPLVFKAVALEQNGEKKVYVDGGVGSNTPVEVFDKDTVTGIEGAAPAEHARAERRARTLLLTFDSDGQAYQIMHGGKPEPAPLGFFGRIKAFLVNLITAHPDQESANLAEQKKIWNAGPDALPVFHGEIGTLSMNISDDMQHQVHMLSAWKALEQIEARMNHAYHMEYDSLEQLASQLSSDEIAALRSGTGLDHQQKQLLAILDGTPHSSPNTGHVGPGASMQA